MDPAWIRALAMLLLAPALAAAQSMEPRAYSNLPVGLNIHALPLGYVRALDVLGTPAA